MNMVELAEQSIREAYEDGYAAGIATARRVIKLFTESTEVDDSEFGEHSRNCMKSVRALLDDAVLDKDEREVA